MTHLRPTAAQFQALTRLPPDRPLVMLNLLRYAADGGEERYANYLHRAKVYVAAVGGAPIYDGRVLMHLVDPAEDVTWDRMLLVRYPSVAAFIGLAQDPEFRSLTPLREEALSAFRLIVLADGQKAG